MEGTVYIHLEQEATEVNVLSVHKDKEKAKKAFVDFVKESRDAAEFLNDTGSGDVVLSCNVDEFRHQLVASSVE